MKKKILVVDDDQTSLKVVQSILVSKGYEVNTSAQADDIEGIVKNFSPDAIIMDLIMPGVDGNAAVKRLQNNPGLSQIPIIFLTAIQMKDEKRGIDFEVNVANKSYRTLTKPPDPKLLVAEIEAITSRR